MVSLLLSHSTWAEFLLWDLHILKSSWLLSWSHFSLQELQHLLTFMFLVYYHRLWCPIYCQEFIIIIVIIIIIKCKLYNVWLSNTVCQFWVSITWHIVILPYMFLDPPCSDSLWKMMNYKTGEASTDGVHKFYKYLGVTSNSRCQKGDMK